MVRTLYVPMEEEAYERLKVLKGDQTWRAFIDSLLDVKEE